MLRGLYTAADGMIAQQRTTETLANNIANVNTPGFKADQVALRSFPELLIRQMGTKNIPTKNGLNLPVSHNIGGLNTGVYVQETIPNFEQGPLKETTLSTDIAIVDRTIPDETGALFYAVANESGDVRYTRNGHFTIDGAGFLTTNEGLYVLDRAGNNIQTGGMDFTVNQAGLIEAPGLNATIGVVYIANANELVKDENDMFSGDVAGIVAVDPEVAGASYTMQQFYLEQSNVDPLSTTSQMMNAYRNFELNQRMLKAYDESLAKAVSEIGRLG